MSHTIETLYSGKHVTLKKQGHWEYASRPKVSGVVGIVAVTAEKKLILVEQWRVPVQRSVIELPAGLAGDLAGQENEPLTSAARRELLEETGYEATDMTPLGEGPTSAGLTDETVTLFLAGTLQKTGPGAGDGSEQITVHEIALPQVAPWLEERRAQGCLIDWKIYAALFYLGKPNLRRTE